MATLKEAIADAYKSLNELTTLKKELLAKGASREELQPVKEEIVAIKRYIYSLEEQDPTITDGIASTMKRFGPKQPVVPTKKKPTAKGPTAIDAIEEKNRQKRIIEDEG